MISHLALVALAAGCREDAPPESEATIAEQSGPTAVVDRVNDGDTLTLRTGVKVRLLQIDAPELFTDCFGRASARTLVALVPRGTHVTLVADRALDDRDDYGRLLRYVFVGRTNVNLELVRRGAASPYFFRKARGRYAITLEKAVAAARASRRGYWGICPRAELNTRLGAITGAAN
jgi:endonuclease YncB( thermonuclease family)